MPIDILQSHGTNGSILADPACVPNSGLDSPLPSIPECPDISNNSSLSVRYYFPRQAHSHRSIILKGYRPPPTTLSESDKDWTRRGGPSAGRGGRHGGRGGSRHSGGSGAANGNGYGQDYPRDNGGPPRSGSFPSARDSVGYGAHSAPSPVGYGYQPPAVPVGGYGGYGYGGGNPYTSSPHSGGGGGAYGEAPYRISWLKLLIPAQAGTRRPLRPVEIPTHLLPTPMHLLLTPTQRYLHHRLAVKAGTPVMVDQEDRVGVTILMEQDHRLHRGGIDRALDLNDRDRHSVDIQLVVHHITMACLPPVLALEPDTDHTFDKLDCHLDSFVHVLLRRTAWDVDEQDWLRAARLLEMVPRQRGPEDESAEVRPHRVARNHLRPIYHPASSLHLLHVESTDDPLAEPRRGGPVFLRLPAGPECVAPPDGPPLAVDVRPRIARPRRALLDVVRLAPVVQPEVQDEVGAVRLDEVRDEFRDGVVGDSDGMVGDQADAGTRVRFGGGRGGGGKGTRESGDDEVGRVDAVLVPRLGSCALQYLIGGIWISRLTPKAVTRTLISSSE